MWTSLVEGEIDVWVFVGSPCLSLSGKHGVGRIDIVENRFIGMKSRGEELKIMFMFVRLSYGIFLSVPDRQWYAL